MFNNRYRYIFIILLAVYSFANSLFSAVYLHYGIEAPWYDILIVFFFITLFVWESNRLVGIKIEKYVKKVNPVKVLVLFLIAGMLMSTLIALFVLYFIGTIVLNLTMTELKMPAILAFTYGTRINLFLHILNAVFYYVNQYKNKELEAEELKRINAQAELQAIKNQINPHFLFNNLNVLSSMIMQDNPDANQFIEEFSKVYRHVLNSQQRELISLKEELEFIQPYLYLMDKRFPEGIFVEMHIPEMFMEYYLVPVSVQMLFENAIKHNIVSRSRPLKIVLSVTEMNYLTISNNLQLKNNGELSTRIGLKNISKRYEMIAGQKIYITETSDSFSVSIPLIQTSL